MLLKDLSTCIGPAPVVRGSGLWQGNLAKDQAKDAGMEWGQGTQDGAAASGSSQDIPGCSRGRKRIM